MAEQVLLYIRVNPNCPSPTRGTPGSAGLDLYSAERYTLFPKELHTFETGLKICLPDGHYGHIVDRSSMARLKLSVKGGIVDK
jgi:dUTP pyrophosphatase